jgi:hypothetical protein
MSPGPHFRLPKGDLVISNVARTFGWWWGAGALQGKRCAAYLQVLDGNRAAAGTIPGFSTTLQGEDPVADFIRMAARKPAEPPFQTYL